MAEFERRGLYAAWGARSTAHCLNFACGISLRTAHDHVRVATRLAELPQVAEAFAGGVISYSKVRAISRIATPESEPALLEAARSASASQLERLVACRETVRRNEAQEVEAKRQFFLHENHDGGYSVSGNLSAEEGALVRAAMAAHKAGLEAAARGEVTRPRAPRSTDRPARGRPTCSCRSSPPPWPQDPRPPILPMLEREGEPLKLGLATRTPSRAQRRALRRRDGGCRFPGCNMRRYVQAHHIWHWENGGATDLANLVLLCSHHHHLVHEGGWTMTGTAKALEIRKPNGSPLPCCPTPVAATGPTVEDQNEQLGLHITASTSNLLGYTYRPNYDEAIQALLDAERPRVNS